MMRVIIDEQKPVALVLDLKATARRLEFAQRNRDFFKGNPKLGAEGDHANGILDIVPDGDVQDCFAQMLPAPINAKQRSKDPQLDVCPAVISGLRKSVAGRDSG